MADEIPMIPKAGNLIVHSGNIVNWNRLKRKPNQRPTDEVYSFEYSGRKSVDINTEFNFQNKTWS